MIPAGGAGGVAPVEQEIKGFVVESEHVAAEVSAQVKPVFFREGKIDLGIEVVEVIIGNAATSRVSLSSRIRLFLISRTPGIVSMAFMILF